MKSQISVKPDELKKSSLEPSTLDRASELFLKHGALWVKNVYSQTFIKQLAVYYSKKYSTLSQGELNRKYANVGNRRYMISMKVKGIFSSPDLYANPRLNSILQRLLGNDFVISSFGSVLALPGAEAQAIHLDHPPLFSSAQLSASLPPYAITLVVPLVEVDHSIGSTAIWEGSHRSSDAWEQLQRLTDEPSLEGASIPLPKLGDAYMMDYRVLHGGMANQSEIARPILYIVYSRPWFRDFSNFQDQPAVRISKKQLKKIPEDFQHLFAY